jgi:hypothetical protein
VGWVIGSTPANTRPATTNRDAKLADAGAFGFRDVHPSGRGTVPTRAAGCLRVHAQLHPEPDAELPLARGSGIAGRTLRGSGLVNHLAFVLGVSSLPSLFGAQYQLGRIVAGSCGAVFVYVAMRRVELRTDVSVVA